MGTTTRDQQTPPAAVEMRLFGPLDVRVGGAPLPPLRSKRGYWMLALLALRADCEVPRSYLAGTLWPDSTDEQALGNLRRTLADLRVALEAIGAGALLDAPSARSLRLRTDAASVLLDVAEFDRAVRRADDEAETERAIALYRGPLLEGCLEEWALLERERREQEYLSALERAAAWAAGRGDHARSAGLLRQAVGRDPLRETAQRALMTALAAQGDFAAATQAFRDLRLHLRDALNAEPDPETTSLYRRLKEESRRRAESGPAPVAAPKPSPQHPTPNTLLPHNLRRPLTGLVGRSCELAEIVAALSDGDGPPLVTLAGTGGVGKTRLAVEAGWSLVREGGAAFPDGVWFVDLAPVSDPARVAPAVAAAVGVRESGQESGRDDLGRLTEALSGRRLLLLLDNCEHLPNACAHVAAELLAACPSVRVLATSRQVLGVPGERVLRVTPLAAAEENSEAVRLFLERARAVAPNFAAPPETPRARAVAEVCRRLDGVPLAIELAAARVRSLPVEDIAARLGDRFRLIGGPAGAGLAPRQRTLEALIGWSYDLLTEPERALLRRLAAFAGGWTLDAAESVCGEDGIDRYEVADLLASLVDKSLVVFEDAEGDGGAPARYRLLETIREYGRARSLEGDAEFAATMDRHLAYYHDLAGRADAAMAHDAPGGVAEAARWKALLGAEMENVRAAWARACALGDPERTLALPTCSVRTLRDRGRMAEARAWVEEALRLQRDLASGPTRARAHGEAAYFAMLAGDYEIARAHNERALALHRELGCSVGVATTLGNLAGLASLRGEHRHAADVLAECAAVYRAEGRRSALANLLHLRSHALLRIPDWPAARADVEEALSTCRALGDAPKLPLLQNTLAVILLGLGETEDARRAAADSLCGAEAVGDKLATATACVTLSNVAQKSGPDDAEWPAVPALLCRALRLLQELGRRYETATVFEEAARYLSTGDPARRRDAARLLGAASRIRTALGVPDGADVPATREALRAALPDFEFLTAAGAALAEQDAVALAFAALGDSPLPSVTFATAPAAALAGAA